MNAIRALLFFLLVLPQFPTAWADSKAELKALRDRLEKLQRDYQATRESHADAVDALRQSERAISDAKRKLNELEIEQQRTRSELDSINTELDHVQAGITDRQKRLGEMLRKAYVRGAGDSLKLLLSGRDPNEVSRELVYLNYLSRSQLQLIESLRQAQHQLDRLRQSAAEKDRLLTEIRQSRIAEQARLVKEKQARQSLLRRLSDQIRAQRKEISTLRQNEKRLTDLIARLSRLARQREAKAGKKAASSASQKRSGPVGVNTEVPVAVQAGIAFSRLKGWLRLPVRGELMNRFGAPRDDGGLKWKGLFLRAPEGAEVKAIAAGRVVFAEWLRGFGNLVIVDHGEGYMSLYSNNESLYKQPGEEVKGGDTLASAGNSGGQEEPGVYFELRHQGRPIDPMAWIKPE